MGQGDIRSEIDFFCQVGRVNASVGILVEPAPHKDPSHGHLHVSLLCEKLLIAVFPEPDRCSVTNRTCRFQSAFGHHILYEESRKKDYANEIILAAAHIEYYGAARLRTHRSSRRQPFDHERASLREIIRALKDSRLIDDETHTELLDLKECRNRLAHDTDVLQRYSEQDLYSFVLRARKLIDVLRTEQSC